MFEPTRSLATPQGRLMAPFEGARLLKVLGITSNTLVRSSQSSSGPAGGASDGYGLGFCYPTEGARQRQGLWPHPQARAHMVAGHAAGAAWGADWGPTPGQFSNPIPECA